MKVIVTKNANEMGIQAAEMVAEIVRNKPDAVLGLATGSTPIPMYAELCRMHREEGLDFSKIRTFNLDEYVGLSEEDPQSYHYFMRENLFSKINIPAENTHVPDGNASDPSAFGAQYEDMIRNVGGIDVQILGIGENGHVGFDEPAEELMVHTGLVNLTDSTIAANARFFDSEADVPTQAITMGMGTIMRAKKIIIVANGLKKHDVIKRICEREFISTWTPVSLLFLHPDATLIVDELAYHGE